MLDPQRFQVAKNMAVMPGGPENNNPMNVTVDASAGSRLKQPVSTVTVEWSVPTDGNWCFVPNADLQVILRTAVIGTR